MNLFNLDGCELKLPKPECVQEETEVYQRSISKMNIAEMVGFTPGQKIRIQNLKGTEYLMQVRKEKSRTYERYAVTGWADYMRSNGISHGEICSFTYHHFDGTLFITEVTKK
ncbi:hypothetical protein L1987_73159 [Smallanthus sonchifolius]|uniref:Uncharacterized protein n=1 Tax=Smallanthus sonchifolius TaxID=185202 RepID=A0ACB8ZZE5_9ASTR|nr:hypothetical protein L1987_73159 [Smallanthus sonchifolius]